MLLTLTSFCVKYILCFDSLSAHIHYINAMKINFTILVYCLDLFKQFINGKWLNLYSVLTSPFGALNFIHSSIQAAM